MEANDLHVYNTLTRQKEPFVTVVPGKVGIYLCGPTVYKPSHLGHMVGPVIFDTVKRYLSYLGYEVTFVVNITDIDDKLIVEAAKQNTTVPELAERITKDYVKNLEILNVTGVDHLPRATHHVDAIIQMIKVLVDKGFAYPAAGDVYFDVTKDEDYGKLCHRDPEQMEAGARIEVSDRKRNPGDFALWKGAKPGEPFWESPWGKGRPGWHIECSAMSMKLLGTTLDIHGGGLDLQFPHHENELAQSESFNGEPFVHYWMHNGLMKTGTEKMSKSKGNEIVVSELLKRHHPETLRFFLLSTHYRRPIDFSEERLEEVRRALDGFYRFFERFERITKKSFFELQAPTARRPIPPNEPAAEFVAEVVGLWEKFLEHMDDDFNTGGAIGILFELLTALNRFADANHLEEGKGSEADLRAFQRGVLILKELSQILGVFHKPAATKEAGDDKLLGGLIQLLIDVRADARKNKNFALSDQIRKRLGELGVTLEDRTAGSIWRIEN
ncbi:MAG: cysteine--tRNA ligase [Planctomycetes bacterium]|nr:cysteine--tRNA ligase [Planctomycetota bacterium]